MLSPQWMKAIYHAHIQSHLNYGLLIWGSMISNKKLRKFTVMQNSCLHLISNKHNCYPTDLIYKEEKLFTISELIQLELCKFGHQVTCKYLPKPILDLLDSRGGKKTHRYNTRYKKTPNIQQHSGTNFNKSFMCQGLEQCNQVPSIIRETKITKLLMKKLKKFLLSG